MIAVSVGFGLFPMHMYNVVRSGVDPLVAKVTHVVPVASSEPDGSGVNRAARIDASLANTGSATYDISRLTPHATRSER
jgi:NADH-quinone oxidoreductase subunit M